MRTKVTLALIFLNVAVFFFIFYLKEGRPIKSPVDYSVIGPEVANIQSIDISGPARPTPIRLEKSGENRTLVKPQVWPANPFAVNTIVNELEQLHSETSFPVKSLEKNGQSLADYGLDKPPLTVTLTAGGSDGIPAKSVVLPIGNTAQVGNRLYILSPDRERVHVVHRSLAESLLVSLDDLRSNVVFSIKVFEVRSLNLQAGAPAGSKVRIAQSEGRWTFETPITTRANKNDMDITISRLNALRIQNFNESRPPESLHLTPEDMTMRITLEGNNRRETLIIGSRVPDQPAATSVAAPVGNLKAPESSPEAGDLYFAKMEDKAETFTISIPASLLETLRNAQESLREKKILDLEPSRVSAVTLTAAGQPELTLQRLETTSKTPLNSSWQLVQRSDQHSPQTLPADRQIVDQLIQHLCQLSAERFEADAPTDAQLESYGFRRPARHIRIALTPPAGAPAGSASSAVVLEFGIGEDRHVYAKLDSPNYVYRVSDDILQQTPIDPLAYRERLLRDLPAGAKITALKLTEPATDKVLLDVSFPLPDENSAAAKTATPPLTPSVRAALDTLVKQLRTLRAKKFVRDQFTKTVLVSGEERPWKYQLTTTLSLVGGNGNQTAVSILFFSDREGGTVQFVGAPDPDFNVVFEAEQPLIDALFAITYGPHDPGPTTPKPGSAN
jgi:hypothetical protein